MAHGTHELDLSDALASSTPPPLHPTDSLGSPRDIEATTKDHLARSQASSVLDEFTSMSEVRSSGWKCACVNQYVFSFDLYYCISRVIDIFRSTSASEARRVLLARLEACVYGLVSRLMFWLDCGTWRAHQEGMANVRLSHKNSISRMAESCV